VLGLKLLGLVQGVVDESESRRLPATEMCLESKAEHEVGCAFVNSSELVADLLLRDGGPVGVDHVHNHLTPREEAIRHELATAERAPFLFRHGHFDDSEYGN